MKKRAAQEDGRTYESHQEPGYFSANSSISQSFEPVWDKRNDQSVDDEIGEESCSRSRVSLRRVNDLEDKHTKHHNYPTIQSSAPRKPKKILPNVTNPIEDLQRRPQGSFPCAYSGLFSPTMVLSVAICIPRAN